VKQRYPALVALHPYGEVLPRRENRVTVEGTPLDAYGVPIARIEYKIGDNERHMAAEMYDTAESILRAAKAEIVPFERNQVDVAGSAIHEHGTCRMGADPKPLRPELLLPVSRCSEYVCRGRLSVHYSQ